MLSYALIANGSHNPYLATPLPEHMVYPISQSSGSGIDLDYGALILGNHFVIDASVYEDVIYSRKEYLKPMQYSLRRLSESGFLVKEDYSSFFSANRDRIIKMTDQLLETPTQWLRLEQNQWRTLAGELLDFQEKYGSAEMWFQNITNIGIESWLSRTNRIEDKPLRKKLYDLFCGKRDVSEFNVTDVKGSLEFIVAQIVMSDLVSHEIGSPILDWDDSRELYERLYNLQWQKNIQDEKLTEETKKLFELTIPELKPNSIDEVIRFISDTKNVRSLRETISGAIERGESIDEDWMRRYNELAFNAHLLVDNRTSKLNLFGNALGVFPLQWPASVACTGGGMLVDRIFQNPKKQFRWYYALKKNQIKKH